MEAASVEVEGLSAAQGMLLAVADQHDAAFDDIAEFLAVMRKTMEEKNYSLMLLMLTDVLREGTPSCGSTVKLSPPSGSSSNIGSI
mgnify:CR=1 FL=1